MAGGSGGGEQEGDGEGERNGEVCGGEEEELGCSRSMTEHCEEVASEALGIIIVILLICLIFTCKLYINPYLLFTLMDLLAWTVSGSIYIVTYYQQLEARLWRFSGTHCHVACK